MELSEEAMELTHMLLDLLGQRSPLVRALNNQQMDIDPEPLQRLPLALLLPMTLLRGLMPMGKLGKPLLFPIFFAYLTSLEQLFPLICTPNRPQNPQVIETDRDPSFHSLDPDPARDDRDDYDVCERDYELKEKDPDSVFRDRDEEAAPRASKCKVPRRYSSTHISRKHRK